MLRVIPNSNVSRAKDYFSKSAGEYYLDGQQELRGVWRGEGAKLLGLSGDISRADWNAICDGFSPKTGEKLVQRLKANRTVGYDFNSHVPKSVSLLYGMTDDPRILSAFRESVDDTMRDIESEMQARVRKNGKDEDRRTGNMVWGEFVHLTARPLDDGIPDCHLHAHCFALNLTKDDSPGEGIWKAGQFRELKRDSPYFEAMFHSRLARKLADLGLPIERTRHGWEIGGVSRDLVDKFSRRTTAIEALAKKKGITDPAAKAELGARTRKRKAQDLTMPELRAEWRSRMTPNEWQTLARLKSRIGGKEIAVEPQAAEQAVKYAIDKEFERRSVLPLRSVLATALKHAVGRSTPDQVISQADRSGLIIGDRNGRTMATTREVLAEEMNMLDWCRRGRGTVGPLGKPDRQIKDRELNKSQLAAVRHILHQSRDRVILLRGPAGTGKSRMMGEVAAGIIENGGRIVPLAPTAEAVEVLRRDGFKAETVAMFLKDPRLQQAAKNSVLWVDEAGLMGSKTVADVFALADKLDSRCILSGDKRQNPSVERGSVLHLLETEAGIKSAELREVVRQRDQYKAVVDALSQGRTDDAFKKLDSLGWIHEIEDDTERYKRIAVDYVDTVMSGKECLVVSPTHLEGRDRVTSEIRQALKERGLLGKERRIFQAIQNTNLTEAERGDASSYLEDGLVIQFHQNGKSYKRGERIKVAGQPLPLEQASKFSVFRSRPLELATGDMIRITFNGKTKDGKHKLVNGKLASVAKFTKSGDIVLDNGWIVAKDYGGITHGYCVTNYSAQGKTIKHRVIVAQSSISLPATTQEGFYVACSRAKESIAIYCDSKEQLKQAVGVPSERFSATDLFRQVKVPVIVDLHRRFTFLNHESTITYERELVRER